MKKAVPMSIVITLFFFASCKENTPPSCEITSPLNASQCVTGEIVEIRVSAVDNNDNLDRVIILVDNNQIYSTDVFPYSYEWNTTSAALGTHTIQAKAIDAEGAETTDQVQITIVASTAYTIDECSGAVLLNVGSQCNFTQYSNASATPSSGDPDPGCASYTGGDVWFKFVAPTSGTIYIDTQAGVLVDGGMAIYSGSCGSLTLIECDDDDGTELMPMIEISGLQLGGTYYIRFWEYNNDNNGTFSICVHN